MAQITSREKLEEWLQDKPTDWGQMIAARAALRALPYVFADEGNPKWANDRALVLVQSTALSWIARSIPAHPVFTSAGLDRYINSSGAPSRSAIRVVYAVSDAASAASAASHVGHDAYAESLGYRNSAYTIKNVPEAVVRSVLEANFLTDTKGWQNVDYDCDLLGGHGDVASASHLLTRVALWPRGSPEDWDMVWANAAARLEALNQGYEVWIDWYKRRIEGCEAAFDIPGDADRAQDKSILVRLADADKGFWNKGAIYVNTTLQRWLDEAPELDHDTIAAITAPLASPDVIARNNQLDVVPNGILDVQSDAFDLGEAIAVLRALVGTLRKCLTGNSSPVFASSLACYDEELEQRGAKPFIGVLVRMEEGVETQFKADPEAFDNGVKIHFRNFFAEHRKFMKHYRHHLEREKVIDGLAIDERAASGKALTSAFEAAALKAEELFAQGLATDGYRSEILAQQANLKALEYSQGSGRAKLLQIVQSVGFLKKSRIAAAALVSTVVVLSDFITVVEAAIAALSKFFV